MAKTTLIDRTGQEFGRLIVTGKAGRQNGRTMWACKCICGNNTTVRSEHLKHGRVQSCGCYSVESHTKHGMARTVEHKTWVAMKQRCFNKKDNSFKDYGSRGITVCDRWRDSFENFIEDMGKKPHPSLTIERVDNDKGYSPDNCVWATRSAQVNNRRNSLLFTFNNETHCLKEWCRRLSVSYSTIRHRICKQGMTFNEAFGIK